MLEQRLNELIQEAYGKTIEECTDAQLYERILQLTKERMEEKPVIGGEKEGILYFNGVSDRKAFVQQSDQSGNL